MLLISCFSKNVTQWKNATEPPLNALYICCHMFTLFDKQLAWFCAMAPSHERIYALVNANRRFVSWRQWREFWAWQHLWFRGISFLVPMFCFSLTLQCIRFSACLTLARCLFSNWRFQSNTPVSQIDWEKTKSNIDFICLTIVLLIFLTM